MKRFQIILTTLTLAIVSSAQASAAPVDGRGADGPEPVDTAWWDKLQEVNEVVNAFFAKTYKHLHAKYENREAKYYRFPIPVGKSGEDLDIKQNPGY